MTQHRDYEIHVTLEHDQYSHSGWHESAISGDPDLGDGLRFYRTAHASDIFQAFELLEQAKRIWPRAIRYKIEHILVDERKASNDTPRKSVARSES